MLYIYYSHRGKQDGGADLTATAGSTADDHALHIYYAHRRTHSIAVGGFTVDDYALYIYYSRRGKKDRTTKFCSQFYMNRFGV